MDVVQYELLIDTILLLTIYCIYDFLCCCFNLLSWKNIVSAEQKKRKIAMESPRTIEGRNYASCSCIHRNRTKTEDRC